VAVGYAWAAAGLLLLQVLVGALNVWLDEYELMILLHLTLGTLLWGTVSTMAMRMAPVPRAEAVPA
jgi:heme A synthase